MGELNVPRAEADALKVIDTQLLTALIERCIRDEHWACLRDLRLYECGPYVALRLRAFEQALSAHAAAKTAKKRDATGYDVRKTEGDLEHAVQQMKDRVATEEREGRNKRNESLAAALGRLGHARRLAALPQRSQAKRARGGRLALRQSLPVRSAAIDTAAGIPVGSMSTDRPSEEY